MVAETILSARIHRYAVAFGEGRKLSPDSQSTPLARAMGSRVAQVQSRWECDLDVQRRSRFFS